MHSSSHVSKWNRNASFIKRKFKTNINKCNQSQNMLVSNLPKFVVVQNCYLPFIDEIHFLCVNNTVSRLLFTCLSLGICYRGGYYQVIHPSLLQKALNQEARSLCSSNQVHIIPELLRNAYSSQAVSVLRRNPWVLDLAI